MKVITELSPKQLEAFRILQDDQTTELFYGGGAGGGKSYLGCCWIITCCLRYPGSRWLIGRARLKTLKESTFLTFLGILRDWGLKKDKDWKYNAMENHVTFSNESAVYLKDLFLYPTDPEFDSLGSTEFTGAFIDEVSEITEKAKNIVMSRIRFKLEEFKLVPKLLMASNPAKNFAYREYWKPWNEGILPKFRKFIPALVGDNPFMPKVYAENLKKMDKNSRERLLYGNWHYDDDPSRLFDYERLQDIFTIEEKLKGLRDNQHYISVDVARFGSDSTVIVIWKGLVIEHVYRNPNTSTKQVKEKIEYFMRIYQVQPYNVIIDEDGVGGGVVDFMRSVKGFVNQSKPIEQPIPKGQLIKHNYANLKTQCYFKLADYINDGYISCPNASPETKQLIVEDLEQIKVKDYEKENKISVIPKEAIIESLGRSPDFADAIMMRMVFEFKRYKPLIG